MFGDAVGIGVSWFDAPLLIGNPFIEIFRPSAIFRFGESDQSAHEISAYSMPSMTSRVPMQVSTEEFTVIDKDNLHFSLCTFHSFEAQPKTDSLCFGTLFS